MELNENHRRQIVVVGRDGCSQCKIMAKFMSSRGQCMAHHQMTSTVFQVSRQLLEQNKQMRNVWLTLKKSVVCRPDWVLLPLTIICLSCRMHQEWSKEDPKGFCSKYRALCDTSVYVQRLRRVTIQLTNPLYTSVVCGTMLWWRFEILKRPSLLTWSSW